MKAEDRYTNMTYRRLGDSGLLLPAVSLGLWHNFGNEKPYENSRAMVLGAFDMGITHFDLANNYGTPGGSAEITTGRVLREDLYAHRDELLISTKAGYRMWPGPYGEWGSKKALIASLDQSLRRMGIDYVDIFYHHRPDPDTRMEETAEALLQILHSGKALYVGISNYSPDDIVRIASYLEQGGSRLLVSQTRYSMLNRVYERGEQQVLKRLRVGAVAFCSLAEGILTQKYLRGIPEDSRAAGTSVFLGKDQVLEYLPTAKKLHSFAEGRGQSLSRLAIQWALRDETMASLLLGASRLSQLEENILALSDPPLEQEELDQLNAILANVADFY